MGPSTPAEYLPGQNPSRQNTKRVEPPRSRNSTLLITVVCRSGGMYKGECGIDDRR